MKTIALDTSMFTNLTSQKSASTNRARMNKGSKTVSQQKIDEEWLLVQAAQKDNKAFRPLYETYYDVIFSFVFRRTGEEYVAADLCSNVFFKALQQIKKYKHRGLPFSAWLYRIAANEVAQYYRNNSKQRVVSVDEAHIGELKEEIQTEEPYTQEMLLQAMDKLKEADIEILELRFFEMRPFKEIAMMLDITESNAKMKTYRVLERLAKHLKALK